MKNISFRFLLTILLSSLFIQSCNNKEAIIQHLSHRWIIEKGFRNEKETDSLSGLYFQFGKTGEVTTNLNGQDERLSYKLKGEDIIEMTGMTQIFLNIIELSESKLILQTDIQGYNFKFEMVKVK